MSTEFNEIVMEAKTTEQTYTYEEALAESIGYFDGDELAAKVWINKYALKDSYGNIFEKSPEQMHWRIANELARMEVKYTNPLSAAQIFEYLSHFKYIVPQGSPMAGIGNPYQIVSLSNCFVIGNSGPSDSYGGIMKIDQEQVQLMKRRGGVGHDLSHIRPKGSPVFNSALTSTGVVPFMERFSNSTREVAQDGRRGALMLSISIKHPDSESFIDAKMESGKVTGANVSVKITDEFMEAVKAGTTFVQQYPFNTDTPLYRKEIDARTLWNKIVFNAWKSAEPGILFWDTIIRESVPDSYADLGYQTVSTNPCGEIPLCPYDSCRLLAMNLYSYVNKPFSKKASFDWTKFKSHMAVAQRVMDDIIDLELEKIDRIIQKIDDDPENKDIKSVERGLWINIRTKAQEGRRTGIGTTAEGDMLASLGLRYGTPEATDFSEELHKQKALATYRASVELAKERGAFKIYDAKREENNPFIGRLREADPALYADMVKYGRRNIALLTIAPTGTTSLMTQTSSGIEPVFMPVYQRRRKVNPNDQESVVTFVDETGDAWEEYNVFHHHFMTWLKTEGHDPIEVRKYSKEQIAELVAISPYYKASSNDVDWVAKVKMQGRIQKWIDHSISVTINLPSDVNTELVGTLYQTAWAEGCKGVTVYRDGSRNGVLLTGNEKKVEDVFMTKRPAELEADVIHFQNNNERWVAFIGIRDGRPYEVFTGIADMEVMPVPKTITKGIIIKNRLKDGSKRYDFRFKNRLGNDVTIGGLSHQFNPEYWNYAKLISGVLRHGMPVVSAVNLIGSLHLDSDTINTWKNGVERALKRYIPDGTKAEGKQKCQSCGSHNLIYQEGCLTCQDCGNSKCG